MANILLVEDEEILGNLIRDALEQKQHAVTWFTDGKKAWEGYPSIEPDLCILDVMLPGLDGFMLAQKIKEVSPTQMILFLTARSNTSDVVKGFESGGNDYLKKPFGLDELFVRVNELLRRNIKTGIITASHLLHIGKFQFNTAAQILKINNKSYRLSFKEAALLKELVLCKNELLERKMILQKLWGDDNFFNARTMDVYVAKLRKCLSEDPSLSIINIRGYGYKLVDQSPAEHP